MNRARTVRGQSSTDSPKPNPLLEGICLASTEKEIFPLIARNPFLNAAWRRQNQDIDLFPAYMAAVVAPTNTALQLGLNIHRALKITLFQKNPTVQQNQTSYFSTASQPSDPVVIHSSYCGVVLSGLTGLGKSHLLEAALQSIPQVVYRENILGLALIAQITWIRIDMTSIASIEALAEQIVRAIDDALKANGDIFEATLKGAKSANTKMERALRLLRTHYVGILAVDEIQANNFSKSGSADIRDWFLRIANQRISLVFSGNPLGFRLLPPKKNEDEKFSTQQLRRLFATNELRRNPAESINDPEWKKFIQTVATCHLDGSRDVFNEKNELLKLQLSGGFEDFYIELHCQLEKLRVKFPAKEVDDSLINQAAAASTKLRKMKPLISAFTEHDIIKLKQCIDVDYDYYIEKWGKRSSQDVGGQSENDPPVSSFVENNKIVVDPVASAEADRKSIERKCSKQREKQSAPSSPLKNSLREHHLDELETVIINGKPPDGS